MDYFHGVCLVKVLQTLLFTLFSARMDSSDDIIVSKVLVVGDVATGKTSLIRRYVHGWFSPDHRTTIGVDFSLKPVPLANGKGELQIQLWDIAGQERFSGLARIYYRDAVGAVVVFDLSEPGSMESAVKWKADLDEKVFLPNGERIPVWLIGNKVDLVDENAREDEMNSFAKNKGFQGWIQTSAKTNHNVEQAFGGLANAIFENHQRMVNDGVIGGKDELVDEKQSTVHLKKSYSRDNNSRSSAIEENNSCC